MSARLHGRTRVCAVNVFLLRRYLYVTGPILTQAVLCNQARIAATDWSVIRKGREERDGRVLAIASWNLVSHED